jgi:hypothetical protein
VNVNVLFQNHRLIWILLSKKKLQRHSWQRAVERFVPVWDFRIDSDTWQGDSGSAAWVNAPPFVQQGMWHWSVEEEIDIVVSMM